MKLTPRLPHFVWSAQCPLPQASTLRPVRACAGRLGAAGLSPLTGGNTGGPAKPAPRCSPNVRPQFHASRKAHGAMDY